MEQDKAVQGGKHIARVLKEEGVEYHFGLHGGHINAFLVGTGMEGIKLVHVRHEQAGFIALMATLRLQGRSVFLFVPPGPA